MDERPIFSVSELAEMLQGLLEDTIPSVRVQGEISNFRNPSGHWYFTLKDAGAQVRCAMFKSTNFYVRPPPKDGDEVQIRGRLTFYPRGGDLQIVVEHMEPAGTGALLRAFEELKKKLAAEGLFDAALKRPIPRAPRCIGLITSRTGAAAQDVLTTLRRRFPLGQVWACAVPVQGDAAVPAIVRALKELPQRAPVDVIILARGGGSIEDLWCFNDERIARAIRACTAPVITGIGHEIDFTIADFAADLRAPTPTAAAELASPDEREWLARVEQLQVRMARRMGMVLQEHIHRVQRSRGRLETLHPGRRLQLHHQRLDEMLERMRRVHGPRIASLRAHLGSRQELMRARLEQGMHRAQERLQRNAALLGSFSPQSTLDRGYAIVQTADGAVARDATALAVGDAVTIRLARGAAGATVTTKEAAPTGSSRTTRPAPG
jgi:exodeoxyribonuclease VII large subunit